MKTVNSVILMGSVARIPEKRMTSRGSPFTTLVIATQKDSIRQDAQIGTEFHNIVAWGGLGVIAENFCKKGKTVYIEGSLKTRSWQHESGVKMFRTEVVASKIIALDHRENEKETRDHLSKNSKRERDDSSFFSAQPEDFLDT